ncbi:sugar phosphate isomerase/epimerase family protein [Lacticaseibacillus saniviri]|uniref:Sugar phosphate isomerase epimerase n=1 Tax=Lacticaseibacillus saniviri JCM 17471 = DSM 24301 TaxID=1293598 RepID=A0A0R2MTI4_9LACO|nr:TIM barrel protein [Lacticaseibacillus saniviri]KRO15563.1 sugar phosphate isomerase epimerase [Lacticaseibacillus saniviri JCM 17471 = DSM 24301]MCG4282695.1 sugar phosphate isomerase/epimerase [Lacticaseibacillus saniviri]
MVQLAANLLLLADEWQAGKSQAELIPELIDLGFNTIEVRREYFRDIDKEMPQIAQLVKEHNLTLYYSVPDDVFVDGQVNQDLQTYLDEGKQMGIKKIKWNIGDFANFDEDLTDALNPLVSQGIEVNIENDQTQISGRLEPVQDFLDAVQTANVDLGYVYDLGNWPFVGEDPLKAAKALAPYVRYIHVKDDVTSGKAPVTVPLDEGDLPWRDILDVLPHNVPVAIEYPTQNHDVITTAMEKVNDYFQA